MRASVGDLFGSIDNDAAGDNRTVMTPLFLMRKRMTEE